MNAARPKRTSFYKPAHSYVSRPFQRKSAVRTQVRIPRVPTVNTKFPTINRKFSTGNSKVSTADLGNKGKAGNSQNNIDDKGYWESGCSRHMTGNISYLSDYEPYDGGYVSFGQGGCKITDKRTIKTGKQHKASCKTKLVNSVTKPLHTWHMDLFGPTSNETSGILRNFITEIENVKDLKVKIIRVLVNKSQNKTSYELFNGRTPAIGFLKPFRCHVMILNTLDHLGKFEAKWDEGYFISNAQDACKADVLESSGNSNPTATLINPSADQMVTLTVETPVPTVSSPVPTACLDDSLQLSRVRPIGTKWVLKNKKEERGIVIRNKARLVAQGHTQKEGIDYKEVFAPVARIVAIRLFLAYASFMGFTVYQMDVKSAFLYGTIDEEVYVMQPPGFQDPEFPARVYKVEKAMYGLHQAPRAWHRGDFILVQVYVDDIIFGSLNPQLYIEFKALIHENFQMSVMGELNFFLGLQVLQKKDDIFLSQDKYVGDILKKFGYLDVRSANTPMDKENPWGKTELVEQAMRGSVKVNHIIYTTFFWSTARIETTDEGTNILATVDGKPITISESSIRRNLKLKDEAEISSLPDAELFKNLTLMGYNISPNQRQYTRRARIAQSSALPTIADEPASPLRDDSQGEACLTVSGLEAEQDRANIIKTSTLPHDSPPRVTSLAADEANLKGKLKMLKDKDGDGAEPSGEDATIKGRSLETGEEAGIERSTDKGSNDTEEMVNVLTSLDAASILTSGVQVSVPPTADVATVSIPPAGEIPTVSVPTGSGVVPTASPIFTTATVATPYLRRKGKEKMVESETPTKKKLQEKMDVQMARQLEEKMARDSQRMNEQIARDAEIARIHAEEELQCKSSQVPDSTKKAPLKEATKRILYVKEEERFKRKEIRLEQDSAKKAKTSKEVSKEDLKTTMQLVPVEEVYVQALQVKHPIINWEIHTEGQRSYWKIIRLGGSTPSYQFFVDMLKHFDREDLNQLWALVKETLNIRQATNTTQALMHDPVEWRLYDSCGVHHVLLRDQEIFMLVERDYPLRKELVIVMISNKLQVENYSQMASELIQKIHKIANSPRQRSIPTASDEFPLPEDFPTASEERFPLLRKRDATAKEVCTANEDKGSRSGIVVTTRAMVVIGGALVVISGVGIGVVVY
nr:copia protein [Tanacetum cinerariifolium]